MTRNEHDLFNGEAGFKKAACAFVTKIVKMKVIDLQLFALTAERRAHRPSIVRKDPTFPDVEVSSLFFDDPACIVS